MWKFSLEILFFFVAILTNKSAVNGAKLKCECYLSGPVGIEGDIDVCGVDDNGIFTDERVTIDSVEGKNANVTGLKFSIESMKLLPKNLELFFVNLLALQIENGNFQEIKQEDIKIFPKLQHLSIDYTKLSKIDGNLFEFNLELRAIFLNDNEISHIVPTAFDHLNHLDTLYLDYNRCRRTLSDARMSRSDVLKLIRRVRNGACVSKIRKCRVNCDDNDE